jgi:hypothetical protein
MRASARPSAGQTGLLPSKAKIEDEEKTGRAIATKERKIRCTTPQQRVRVLVDPIRHAWESCNPGVTLPFVLARSLTSNYLAYRLSGAGTNGQPALGVDATTRENHSRVIGNRANAFSLKRWPRHEDPNA